MKWGNRYNHEFVNRLYYSILKHTKNKTRLICFTDDSKGIDDNVICKDLPEMTLPKQMGNHVVFSDMLRKVILMNLMQQNNPGT